MKKYIVTVHTEELHGRIDTSRQIKCYSAKQAENVFENEYMRLARKHELTVDEDIDDNTRVIEYFPKMRTTLSIAEA